MTEREKITVTIDVDLEDIVPGFLASKRQDIKLMYQALKEENFVDIQTRGHRMKGDGQGYGFAEITEVGGDLEIQAKNQEKEAVLSSLSRLEHYLDSIVIVYEEMD